MPKAARREQAARYAAGALSPGPGRAGGLDVLSQDPQLSVKRRESASHTRGTNTWAPRAGEAQAPGERRTAGGRALKITLLKIIQQQAKKF